MKSKVFALFACVLIGLCFPIITHAESVSAYATIFASKGSTYPWYDEGSYFDNWAYPNIDCLLCTGFGDLSIPENAEITDVSFEVADECTVSNWGELFNVSFIDDRSDIWRAYNENVYLNTSETERVIDPGLEGWTNNFTPDTFSNDNYGICLAYGANDYPPYARIDVNKVVEITVSYSQ